MSALRGNLKNYPSGATHDTISVLDILITCSLYAGCLFLNAQFIIYMYNVM